MYILTTLRLHLRTHTIVSVVDTKGKLSNMQPFKCENSGRVLAKLHPVVCIDALSFSVTSADSYKVHNYSRSKLLGHLS